MGVNIEITRITFNENYCLKSGMNKKVIGTQNQSLY